MHGKTFAKLFLGALVKRSDVTKKKCGTCKGYGLWAIGDPVPMGSMDAEDGMPTKECPECKENPNPYPLE